MLLGKEQILKAQDLPHEDVEVPEWGGSVRVRTMTALEASKFENSIMKIKGKNIEQNLENYKIKLLSLTLVDEAGEKLFSEKEVEVLGQKSALAINRLFDVAQRLNGMGDMEEQIKNSEADQ